MITPLHALSGGSNAATNPDPQAKSDPFEQSEKPAKGAIVARMRSLIDANRIWPKPRRMWYRQRNPIDKTDTSKLECR